MKSYVGNTTIVNIKILVEENFENTIKVFNFLFERYTTYCISNLKYRVLLLQYLATLVSITSVHKSQLFFNNNYNKIV